MIPQGIIELVLINSKHLQYPPARKKTMVIQVNENLNIYNIYVKIILIKEISRSMAPEESIFDEASKRPKKKKVVEKKKSFKLFDDIPPSNARGAYKELGVEPEMKEIFGKIDNMRQEIVTKMENVFQKGGISQDELGEYLHNPDNFSDQEWKFVSGRRDEIMNDLWKLVGKNTKEVHKKKKKKKVSGERKRKTLGSRKKWIPMR